MFLPVQDNQILAHRRGFGGERSYKYIPLNKNRFVKTGTICRKTEEWFLGFFCNTGTTLELNFHIFSTHMLAVLASYLIFTPHLIAHQVKIDSFKKQTPI